MGNEDIFMGISEIKATVQNMVNAKMKFGDYKSNYDGLEKQYSSPEFYTTNDDTIRVFHDKNSQKVAVIKVETCPQNNSFYKISIYDNLAQRTYVADGVSLETDNPIFTIIEGNGYKIVDNGNGYIDKDDTITCDNETKTISEFLG